MDKKDWMNTYTQNHLMGYAKLLAMIGREYLSGEQSMESMTDCSRQMLLARRQADMSRIMFGRFVLDAAGHLEQIAQNDLEEELLCERQKKRVQKELAKVGILLHSYLKKKNRNDHDEIEMVISARGRDFYNVSDIADLLSRLMHKTMLPLSDGYRYVHQERIPVLFEEDTPFQIDSGYARATKDEEEISGDNYLLRDFGDGTFVAAIADGMGSGELACEDSEKALSLLEQFLEVGLSVPELINTCNRLFYLRKDLEQSVTMDIFICNQYTGDASLYKYGAAGSYLLRGRKIRSIGGSGVALGVHQSPRGSVETLYLRPDDILILLSDGVMDYYEEHIDEFERVLTSSQVNTLAELSAAILRAVIVKREGILLDDMTVVALQIYEKEG